MLTVHSQGRPGHRRSSYSQTTGAFTSLGALPRRGSTSSIPLAKKPTFHFRQDDHDDDDEDDDDDELVMPLRLKISTNNVPFPRSSSSSPLHSPSVGRPPLGKPFKSSLKSSTSSPNIPFPSQSLVPSIMFPDLHPKQQQQQQQHQRASSAPCTPLFASFSSPTHHKNVHFPSQDLATIRVFNRSARPASLGRLGEEPETETEGEASSSAGKYVGGSTFPFPAQVSEKSPLNPSKQKYQINWSQSSGIPRTNVDRAIENVFFESLHVIAGANDEAVLEGTLLVRNITYQKTVMVRYTMDDWETVNDVSAWYHLAVPNGWDRFKFSVTLDSGSQHALENRVMWFVGKYTGADGQGVEWWDNNDGKNYKVGFKKVEVEGYKRGVAVSAPTTPTRPKLQISSSASFPFLGQQERERTHYQAAITQTTLARLKKLNLKNYAAPSAYGKQTTTTPPLPVLTGTPSFVDPSPTSEMSSPTTSTDSTPLQTPTPDDEEDDKLTWSLCLENGQFATTLVPSSPDRTPIASPIPTYPSSDIEKMGTSPPFSEGSVHWDWGSAAGDAFSSSGGESSSPSSSGGMMPPQMKRGLPKAESLSESGNESTPPSSIPTPTATITSPPLKRKPTPPKLNLPTSNTVQSPNARRPPHRRYFQPSVVHSPPTPSGGGDSDAIYQALVREWCFAQGPTTSGEMTPKVQADGGTTKSPSPLARGLTCTLGDE